jgi:UDP:flavonoid glycosyltransferase YjiC (YdhE family)
MNSFIFKKEHPKTRLLFAHGGYSSFMEAAKNGIPILFVPLFADQAINAKRAERFGISETLDKRKLNAETIENFLLKMLNNKRLSLYYLTKRVGNKFFSVTIKMRGSSR